MSLPRKKSEPSTGHGTVIEHACYRTYCRVREQDLRRSGCHPIGNIVWVFNGSPAMDAQKVNKKLTKFGVWGGHAV